LSLLLSLFQPDSRQQLGLLEKKKDYRIRAKNYNEKKDTLKKLRKQALEKNPDEFYFHMINSEMRDGVHKEKVKKEVMTNKTYANSRLEVVEKSISSLWELIKNKFTI